mmetsp:Transcript_36479/g.88405  ORF Transcript_36479/g.88405 Transcript_36479/m.88405 type:complete len:477 (-) Transcript_36479:270-1700(-)
MITRSTIRSSSRRLCFYGCLCTFIILLSSLQSSTATFNPMYNPQQHQSYYYSNHDDNDYANGNYYDQNQQFDHDADSLRGGSTMTIPSPQMHMSQHEQDEGEQPFHPPKILLKHMSMALRVTCELNRRLLEGVNRTFKFFNKKSRIRNNDANHHHHHHQPEQQQQQLVSQQDPYYDPHQQQLQQQELQPYGSEPVNIHPDRTWNPPIQEGGPDLEQESLTIFHALTPHDDELALLEDVESKESNKLEESSASAASSSNQKVATTTTTTTPRGVAHWGPELLPYLEQVTKLLQIDSSGLEIALAMIYLDRACSVDTIRSNGCPPCPFCVPRTVHRLSLVALILAKQAVSGNNNKTVQEYLQDLKPLGIPLDQLELMADWMVNALGDNGSFVTVGQMKVWSQNWEAAFFPKRHQALQQQRQKEAQQRLIQLEQQRLMEQEQQQQLQQQQQYQHQQQYQQGYQHQQRHPSYDHQEEYYQ